MLRISQQVVVLETFLNCGIFTFSTISVANLNPGFEKTRNDRNLDKNLESSKLAYFSKCRR